MNLNLAVMPEVDEVEVNINPEDIEISTARSSGGTYTIVKACHLLPIKNDIKLTFSFLTLKRIIK